MTPSCQSYHGAIEERLRDGTIGVETLWRAQTISPRRRANPVQGKTPNQRTIHWTPQSLSRRKTTHVLDEVSRHDECLASQADSPTKTNTVCASVSRYVEACLLRMGLNSSVSTDPGLPLGRVGKFGNGQRLHASRHCFHCSRATSSCIARLTTKSGPLQRGRIAWNMNSRLRRKAIKLCREQNYLLYPGAPRQTAYRNQEHRMKR